MEQEDAKECLTTALDFFKSDEEKRVNLFLLWKENKKMLFSKAVIGRVEKQSFIDRFVNDYSLEDEFTSYSVMLDKTDYKLFGEQGDFPNITDYINKMDTEAADKGYIEDLSTFRQNLNKAKGYCADIFSGDIHYYVFGSVSTFNALTSKRKFGLLGNVSSNGITKLDDNEKIMGFNNKTICFVKDKFCIINTKKAFEDLFGLLAKYEEVGNDAIDALRKYPLFFQNLDSIKTDLAKKPVLYRSLVNLYKNPDRIDKISKHLKEITDIKNSPTFNDKYDKLQINSSGVVYSSDSLSQFLSLLNERPVQSLITKDEFMAVRDE